MKIKRTNVYVEQTFCVFNFRVLPQSTKEFQHENLRQKIGWKFLKSLYLYLMHGEQSISWLPGVYNHDLLELSAIQQEKSIDAHVSFNAISCSVCEL